MHPNEPAPPSKPYTVHDVLAGAYRGGRVSLKATLSHASLDGGRTALCGRASSLCDIGPDVVTCPTCAKRARRNCRRSTEF